MENMKLAIKQCQARTSTEESSRMRFIVQKIGKLTFFTLQRMIQRLMPLFDKDGVCRFKKYTLARVIERLKSIRQGKVNFQGIITFSITKPDDEQQKMLGLLGVSVS